MKQDTKEVNPSDILGDRTYPNYKGYNEFQQYNSPPVKEHECKHEEDWKEFKAIKQEFRTFKDRVLVFIGAKEATNGALKDTDNTLAGRLTRIEDKLDKMIWGLLLIAVAVIIALIK